MRTFTHSLGPAPPKLHLVQYAQRVVGFISPVAFAPCGESVLDTEPAEGIADETADRCEVCFPPDVEAPKP